MEDKGRLKTVSRVLCIYSILMCSFSITGHFYLFFTRRTDVVELPEALVALFGLGLVVITSFLIFASLRKQKGEGSSKGRMKLRIIIQVLSIYSILICSYSIGGNLYMFFTKKAHVMELSGVLFSLFAFTPVIIMSILAFTYLREREMHFT
jgi:membrane protein YdbS with pleckstrin-like domain